MAVFNPDVVKESDTTRPKEYLTWPETTQPQADTSKGILLKGAADVITGAATSADKLVQSLASADVRKGVDEIRDSFTDALKKEDINRTLADASGTPGVTSQSAKDYIEGKSGSLLPTSSAAPAPLKNALDGAMILRSASNSRKISETYYFGQIADLSSDLRAKYGPGYADYIDSRISEITGVTPANALIKSIISDIGKTGEEAKKRREHTETVLTDLNKQGVFGADRILTAYQRKLYSDEDTNAWINKASRDFYATKVRKDLQDNVNMTREAVEKSTAVEVDMKLSSMSSESFNPVMRVSGMDNPIKVVELMEGAASGKYKIDAVAAQEMDRNIVSMKAQYQAAARAWANSGGVNSPISKMAGGVEAFEKKLDLQSKMYDTMGDLIRNKEYGWAYMFKRMNDALYEQGEHRVLTSSTLGDITLKMHAFKKALGEQATSAILTHALMTDLPEKIKDYLFEKTMDMHIGEVRPVSKIIEEAEKVKIAGERPVNLPAFNKGLLDQGKTLSDTSVDINVRKRIAKSFFGRNDNDLLDKFPPEQPDPRNPNRVLSGKLAAYEGLTNQNTTQAMWDIGKTDKNYWGDYRNWTTTSFGLLFRTEINRLGDIQGMGYKVKWDNEAHKLEIINKDGKPVEQGDRFHAQDKLAFRVQENLNRGLVNLSGVYKQEKSDPNPVLIQLLGNIGGRAGFDVTKVDNLPQLVIDAIAASKAKEAARPKTTSEAFGTFNTKDPNKDTARVPVGLPPLVGIPD